MHATALPGGTEDPSDRRFQPLVCIGDDQLHAAQAAAGQAFEEGGPEGLSFARTDVQTDDLSLALGVHRHGDYCGNRNDAAALALLEVGGVQPEIRPVADKGAVEEGADALVDVLAQLAHRAFADPR